MGISAKSSGADVGDIKANANAAVPAGWLLCGGQAVSRTTYSALFLAIGVLYGAGDGSTTFNVPDLRGRTIFGKDNMGGTAANRLTTANGGLDGLTLGAVGGGETKTLTTAQMPSHNHSVSNQSVGANNTGGSLGSAPTVTSASSGNQGGGGAHSVIPPAMVSNFIIKA